MALCKRVIISSLELIDVRARGRSVCRLLDLARAGHTVYRSDPLAVGISMLAGKKGRSPYRAAVVDMNMRLSGELSGRRILEVLLGYRGASIARRLGVRRLLREPVHIFADEARHVLHGMLPPDAVLHYMVENMTGYVMIVSEARVLKGIVDETNVLERLSEVRTHVRVGDAMSRDLFTTRSDEMLLKASRRMVEGRVRRLPVISRGGRLKGIITITDILSYILDTGKYADLLRCDTNVRILELMEREKVGDAMTSKVVTIGQDDDLGRAVDKMLEHDVSGLPVVDDSGRLIGILSRIDVIAGLAKLKGLHTLVELVCGEPTHELNRQ